MNDLRWKDELTGSCSSLQHQAILKPAENLELWVAQFGAYDEKGADFSAALYKTTDGFQGCVWSARPGHNDEFKDTDLSTACRMALWRTLEYARKENLPEAEALKTAWDNLYENQPLNAVTDGDVYFNPFFGDLWLAQNGKLVKINDGYEIDATEPLGFVRVGRIRNIKLHRTNGDLQDGPDMPAKEFDVTLKAEGMITVRAADMKQATEIASKAPLHDIKWARGYHGYDVKRHDT